MKALLLCASHNDLGLIRALKELKYEILAIGSIPGLVGEQYVDRYIQMDYSDKERVLELAQQEKIDAIVQCCNDFGVYTAAYVAEKMGLPGYDSYETTLTLHNKDKFKAFAKEHNIISPVTNRFTNRADAIDYVSSTSFPIIVKPTDASAGNGISKAETVDEAYHAIDYAFEKSRAGVIVIEPYISGSQHGFCTFLIDKKVAAVCSNNEYSILNPYRVEIDTYPADNADKVTDILVGQIEEIASILDLKDGIFHLQYIMDGETPQIIEVMRRILGNMYHVPGNMSTGIDWEYWETRVRCGLDIKDFPEEVHSKGFYAYKTILAPSNGVIDRICISDKYKMNMYNSILLLHEGDLVERYQSQPVGFLFLQYSSYEEMKSALIDEYDNDMVILRQ